MIKFYKAPVKVNGTVEGIMIAAPPLKKTLGVDILLEFITQRIYKTMF
jgi:hypothetical protein